MLGNNKLGETRIPVTPVQSISLVFEHPYRVRKIFVTFKYCLIYTRKLFAPILYPAKVGHKQFACSSSYIWVLKFFAYATDVHMHARAIDCISIDSQATQIFLLAWRVRRRESGQQRDYHFGASSSYVVFISIIRHISIKWCDDKIICRAGLLTIWKEFGNNVGCSVYVVYYLQLRSPNVLRCRVQTWVTLYGYQ